MTGREYLQTSFSIEHLASLTEDDFTEGTITFEYRDTNGAMVLARKGDHVKNKLTQDQIAQKAKVTSREVNLIETFREYGGGNNERKEYVQRQLAMALRRKKSILFSRSSEVYTRSSRQPAKFRVLLSREEAYRRSRVLLYNLRGNREDRIFMDELNEKLEEKRWYFNEVILKHGPVLHNDLILLMDIPEVITEKADAIAQTGDTKWALDKLNVAENRVVFVYGGRERIRLERIARNPNIETDDPEIARLRMIYTLEDDINNFPVLEVFRKKRSGEPFTTSISP